MRKLISMLVLSLLFTGCDETKKVIDAAGQVQLSGTYHILSIGQDIISENAPNITFSALEKKVNGSTGCNRFFGTYTLDLYALGFSEIASTEMACEEPIMTRENAFLSALDQTGSYTLETEILTLYSKTDRSVLLTAKKQYRTEN